MRLLTIVLLLSAGNILAAECPPPGLGAQETLAKFQEIDRSAQSDFDAGRFPEAARQYREAACLAPKSARAYFGLGSSEAAAGNYTAAHEAFATAAALLPQSPMPLAMLVRVSVAMHDVPTIKDALRTAADRLPRDAELHSGLARFLAENQMLDLALAESLRFEQTGSSNAESSVALAALENTVGAYEEAIRHASTVENSGQIDDRVKASAAGIAGLSFEGLGDRDQAVRELKLAIQLSPQQENSYLALADLYEKAEKFKDAAEVLQEGRLRIPNATSLLLPLGNNLVWAGQMESAIPVLSEVKRKSPDTLEVYIRLAEAYRKLGRPEQEVATLKDLARMKPDYPMLHLLRAQAMLTMDSPDHQRILEELAAAEKSTPADAGVFYVRGKVYAELKRYPEAVASFQRAIELQPLDPSPYYQLGLLYRKIGNMSQAREMMDRFEYLQPPARR